MAQIEDMNDDPFKISRPYLLYFPRNESLKSDTVGLERFIVPNASAIPILKGSSMVIKLYFNVFRFS